jgi:hypothetical protein
MMHFVHPLDGSKIKGLRGCKKGMLSNESWQRSVRIQMNCFVLHPLDGSKIKGLRGCKKEEHNVSMSLIRRPSAAISKHIEEKDM